MLTILIKLSCSRIEQNKLKIVGLSRQYLILFLSCITAELNYNYLIISEMPQNDAEVVIYFFKFSRMLLRRECTLYWLRKQILIPTLESSDIVKMSLSFLFVIVFNFT